MANGNGKRNAEDAVAFSNIFDFTDSMTGEQYSKRNEPVVGTPATRKGAGIDKVVPDQKNRGWMSGWEKARKRVATSPVSFHADELLPMAKGLLGSADSLEQPFRDIEGNLFGGSGKQRKGPMYGLPLDVRLSSLLGNVKRGDDIVDCYIRGLETPTRRKTYALQQPPGRSFGLSGETRDARDYQTRQQKRFQTQEDNIQALQQDANIARKEADMYQQILGAQGSQQGGTGDPSKKQQQTMV